MEWFLGIALFLPLIGGLFLAPLKNLLGKRLGWVAFAFPVISFTSIATMAVMGGHQGSTLIEWPWVPSLGISLSFLIDGLSLLFGMIVSGVGVLIFFYANHYFHGDEEGLNRFYAYLTLFMATMLGTVFADNLILLFIFWEGTGITSFLLIGFLHDKDSSRVGARMALLVTVFTGLFLLVGAIGTGLIAGTFSISELMAGGVPLGADSTLLNAMLFLILLGAFGKSAQFPFQFWLPRAMEAPTPVSAYLHSATMVKLGVFLAARLFPVFSFADLWYPLLTLIGFGTMAFAAFLALRSNKLKAILAYSTVTQLGALIGVYGLSAHSGIFADSFHILDHVFYKAALFMIVGIITHATGCTDIRQVGGLYRAMPVTAWAAGIACASMAGLPLTMGFVSKEVILADITKLIGKGDLIAILALLLLAFATVCKVAFAARFFTRIFLGEQPREMAAHLHKPSLAFQLPPAILVGCSVAFGLLMPLANGLVEYLSVAAMEPRHYHLALIHFDHNLVISLLLLGVGYRLYRRGEKAEWSWTTIPAPLRFDVGFEAFLKRFNRFTVSTTRFLRSESPIDYLPVMLSVMTLLAGGFLFREFVEQTSPAFRIADWASQSEFLRVFAALLIAVACIGVPIVRQWTTQLILASTAGFLTTFYFVLYHAPDLALTQILVESATLLLVLLLLGRFPVPAQEGEQSDRSFNRRNGLNLAIAAGVGTVITFSILIANAVPPPERLGDVILEKTYKYAEGTNAVNTILVDFRGFDTLGEIAVLVIAILGSLGLFFRYKRSDAERKMKALGAPGFGIFHTQPVEKKEEEGR